MTPEVREVVESLGDPVQVAALEPVVVGGVSHGSSGPGMSVRPLRANRSGKIW